MAAERETEIGVDPIAHRGGDVRGSVRARKESGVEEMKAIVLAKTETVIEVGTLVKYKWNEGAMNECDEYDEYDE